MQGPVASKKPLILLLSDLEMLVAGNQVLAETVKGLLRAGFRVTLSTRRKPLFEMAATADPRLVLGELAAGFSVCRHASLATQGIDLARQVWRRFFARVGSSREIDFPPSNAIVGFEHVASMPAAATHLRYWLVWRDALAAARRLAALEKPVAVFGLEIGGTVPASILGRELGVPVIVKFQGTIAYPFLSERREYRIRSHILGLSAAADLYVMHNDGTRGEEVLQSLGVPHERIRCWLDGVRKDSRANIVSRPDVLRDLGLAIPPSSAILLTLSNHAAMYKRLDRAVRALAVVVRNVDAHLVMAGRGRYTEALERLARAEGVADRVHLVSGVPHRKTAALLNASDVYLNTNDVSNLSNTVLEALECGSVVVSMDDGSLRGVVTHGENGLLVPPKACAAELPKAILKVIRNPTLAASLRSGARRFADARLVSLEDRLEREVAEIRALIGNA